MLRILMIAGTRWELLASQLAPKPGIHDPGLVQNAGDPASNTPALYPGAEKYVKCDDA